MARTTITVPDEVKHRMSEVEKSGIPFNWSAIASMAFVTAIDAAVSRKSTDRVDGIAGRLKATRFARLEEEFEIGEHDGRLWAELRADIHELRRLQIFMNSKEWPKFFNDQHGLGSQPRDRLEAVIVSGQFDVFRSAIFWAEVRSLDKANSTVRIYQTEHYLKGWVKGVLSTWMEVTTVHPYLGSL